MFRFSLNYLSIFLLIISCLSFFNIIYSYYFDLYISINSYFYTFLISSVFGFIFFFKKQKFLKITIYNKIFAVILGYIVLPLIIAIPYGINLNNVSLLDCYFEAISGFTSTGFTVFDNIKHLDESLIIWRSTSQWIGGLYFLFSIILLIDIFDNSLKNSLTNFISFNTTEAFKQTLKILILYISLTVFIFLILKLINLRTFDSLNLSLSVISSGGFLPTNAIDFILNNDLKKFVFSILMLSSYFSLFLGYNLIFSKNRNINFFSEDIYLLIYLIFLIIVFFVFLNFNYDFISIFFSLVSSISNIGISLNNVPNNLYFIFLILVIIGGSFFSTSSGIRFLKIFALIKFSINELLSHTKPKHIYINKMTFSDTIIDQSDLYKYFLSIIVFILSLFLVSSLLTISGINFENSFKLAILTLMNTVNSSMYNLGSIDFFGMNFFSKSTLILFMIIGRVELLTILIICKKFLFKN
tara:strand:- start:742 stop:2148 length:1407 start_codon:yes stop_codon:yes gene_type:complete